MTRARASLVTTIALFACACSDSKDSVTNPGNSPEPARVEVTIGVNGDASLAEPSYAVTLDGIELLHVGVGKTVPLIFQGGTHTIAFNVASTQFTPSWCTAFGPTSFPGKYVAGSRAAIAFNVDCAPLTGTGILRLTLEALRGGTSINTDMPIRFTRRIGSANIVVATVPTNTAVELTLQPGIYSFQGNVTAGCALPDGLQAALTGTTRVVVRQDQTSPVRIKLSCGQ